MKIVTAGFLRAFFMFALVVCLAAFNPLVTQAAYSYGNSGTGLLPANHFNGLTIGPIAQYVVGANNELQAWVRNNDNFPKQLELTKYICRCQEALGSPNTGTAIGQCQYYWTPDANPTSLACQPVPETITLAPAESRLISQSVRQYNNQACGSTQLDFVLDKINGIPTGTAAAWGASFANMVTDCPAPTPPPTICTPNVRQQCFNGAVYSYDSCGNRGEALQTCNSNQLCVNNTTDLAFCQNQNNQNDLVVSCSSNPTTTNINQQVVFNPSVSGGNGNYVYQWMGACTGSTQPCPRTFTSPGTYTALLNVTSGNQTQQASCNVTVNPTQTIACSSNSQCGNNSFVGSPFCQNGNVFQNFRTFTCNNPGATNSSCSNSTVPQQQTVCGQNQTCNNGSCTQNQSNLVVSCSANPNPANVNQQVNFIPNVSGGTGNYIYQWSAACNGSGQNCSNAFGNSGNYSALLTVTSGNQTQQTSCNVVVNQTTNPPICQGQSQTQSVDILTGDQDGFGTTLTPGGSYNNINNFRPSSNDPLPMDRVLVANSWSPLARLNSFATSSFAAKPSAFSINLSSIPAGATITGATLTLNTADIDNGQIGIDDKLFINNQEVFGAFANTNQYISGVAGRSGITTISLNSSMIQQALANGSLSVLIDEPTRNGSYLVDGQDNQAEIFAIDYANLHVNYTNCNNNQTITCSSNSQCGNNSLVGSPFCQNGNVFQNFKTFTCNNPGTTNSSCSDSTSPQLQTACNSSQTCNNGSCTQNQSNLVVSCSANPNPTNPNQQVNFISTATGGNGNYTYQWSAGCSGFVQNCSRTFASPGIYTSLLAVTSGNQTQYTSCNLTVTPPVTQPQCSDGIDNDGDGLIDYPQDLGCTNAQDNNESNALITCSSNAQCGTNTLVGSSFCQNGNVFQNYKTFTCNNPGTVNSSCSDSTAPQLQTNCTGNQICSNGSCSNQTIACSTNAQCGTNSLVGSSFCQNGNVFQNYKTFTCNNPGTANSSCSDSTAPQQQTVCGQNQTCSGGTCSNNPANLVISCAVSPTSVNTNQQVDFTAAATGGTGNYTYQWSAGCTGVGQTCSKNFTVGGIYTALLAVTSGTQTQYTSCNVTVTQAVTPRCTTNSDCGTNTLTGSTFCQNGNVFQNFKTYTCNSPGTANSSCSDSTAPQQQSTCSGNQTCNNGSCVNQNITCSNNSQCGTTGPTGSPFCSGNGVYQNYITSTCNNPGTSNSSCSQTTTQQLQTNCIYGQTCSNGTCSNTQNTCNTHSYQQCSGNSVHWYNSCGNDEGISQFCNSNQTCQNNSCVSSCTSHASQQCIGNSVYWFNSCGAQEGVSQICSTNQTCQNNSCSNTQSQSITVTKEVKNISSGNQAWYNFVNAHPGDNVTFRITIYSPTAHNNVTVRDVLPFGITYQNQLVVNGSSNSGNIITGVNIGSMYAGQTIVITYQAHIN